MHRPDHRFGVKADVGLRPAPFANKPISFHETHFLHCRMGTIIPPVLGFTKVSDVNHLSGYSDLQEAT